MPAAMSSHHGKRHPVRLVPPATSVVENAPFPAPLAPFVGRARELTALRDLVPRPDVRLLTLTGPGGVGKTRLALQTAMESADHFPDGTVFVALAPVAEPDHVVPAIARAVGVRDAGDQPAAPRLIAALRERRVLLLLDNLEHLLEAGPAIAAVLEACPRATALATSRSALGIYGERTYAVPPLDLPHRSFETDPTATLGDAASCDSMRLFVARAQSARADFSLSEANAAAVAAICRRLDGLPLAIELAAARIGHLAPTALLSRLEPRLPLLSGGPRDHPARLRTMRDAIAWSHDLLTPEEQRLFRRLTVFVGGFTPEAAQDVCGNGDADAIFDLIASLAGKSLLTLLDDVGETAFGPRYGMLETVREYGQERLAASGETESIRARHAAWCLELTERAAPMIVGPQQKAWLDRLEHDHDNLRSALAWTLDRGDAELGLRLAGALWWFWWMRGFRVEGRDTLERLLALPARVSPPVRAKGLLAAGALGVGQLTPAHSAARLEESLARYRELGDATGIGHALLALGYLAAYGGDWDRATTHLRGSLTHFRHVMDRWGTGGALAGLAWAALYTGDLGRAHSLAEEALAVARETDDPQGIASLLIVLATIALERRDSATATELAHEALRLTRQTGERGQVPPRLELLAAAMGASGAAAHATRLFGAAAALRELVGLPLPGMAPPGYHQHVAAVRTALGEAAFAAAWDAGRALSFAEALDEATAPAANAAGESGRLSSDQRGGLTPRELMVLRLLVEGRSDKDIAAALFVSPRTATTHVASILGKLGVTSRTAAAAVAVRRGLA